MGRINKLRENTNAFFDKLEAHLDSIERHAGQTKEEIQNNFEKTKLAFSDKIEASKLKLARADNLTQEKKDAIKGKLEHLQIQLTLGKAEGKDAFELQKKKISEAIQEVDNEIQSDINVIDDALGYACDEFDAELEEMDIEFQEDIDDTKRRLGEIKTELKESIQNVRQKIEAKKKITGSKVTDLKGEFSDQLDKVRSVITGKRE